MVPTNPVLLASYDYHLVALSIVISILASYAALDLAGRVAGAHGHAHLAWLVGGACAMGIGIWSMHYIGMLAFTLPVSVSYDLPAVAASLGCAIFASGVAMFVASRPQMLVASVVWQHRGGERDCGHATACHVQLFFASGDSIARPGHRDLTGGIAAGVYSSIDNRGRGWKKTPAPW